MQTARVSSKWLFMIPSLSFLLCSSVLNETAIYDMVCVLISTVPW